MISLAFILKAIKKGSHHFNFTDFFEHETIAVEIGGYVFFFFFFFFTTVVKCIQATNVLGMLLVHVLTSCVSVSLTADIILCCQRWDCHKATRLAMCLG